MTVSNIALKSASMRCYDLHIARPKTMSTNWGSKISSSIRLELKSPKALIPIVCYVCKAKRGTVYATCENQECAQSKIRNVQGAEKEVAGAKQGAAVEVSEAPNRIGGWQEQSTP